VTQTDRRYAVCIEETLGHRAHGGNIRRAIEDRGFAADMLAVTPPANPRVPMPWALRGSIDAMWAVRRSSYDSVFFHTQTVSLLASLATRGAPYVVSLDATPVQFDAMGRWYDHQTGQPAAERVKRAWYRQVLNRAAAVVTWSDWALESLRDDYDVDPSVSLVAHPGAGPAFFAIERCDTPRRPTILFVGGQFERKGGPALLEAFESLADRANLVIVTEDQIDVPAGVIVRRDIRPGTTALQDVFANADIFCLPTLGDCTPVAIGEAMAAGLPVVTTTVGSNHETVPEGAGLLVQPGDIEGLRAALTRLIDAPEERPAMGARARAHAREHMDSDRNANRILDLLMAVAR